MSMDPLHSRDGDLYDLRATLNGKRANSATVKVSAESLDRLLKDHHTLYGHLSATGKLVVGLGEDQASLLSNVPDADIPRLEKACAQRRAAMARPK